MAGRPKSITGFQTHTTPVLVSARDRAELADEAFVALSNVAEGIVVLPHIGGPHPQRDRFVARLFVENLGRFLDGKPLKEIVDRTAGY